MLVNVKTKACTDAILGDLGRFPMYIYGIISNSNN